MATHCMLDNIDGIVTINPMNENAHCFINNLEIKSAYKLSQGLVIIMWRFKIFSKIKYSFFTKGDLVSLSNTVLKFNQRCVNAMLTNTSSSSINLDLKSQSMPSLDNLDASKNALFNKNFFQIKNK